MFIVAWKLFNDTSRGCDLPYFSAGILEKSFKTLAEAKKAIEADVKKYREVDLFKSFYDEDCDNQEAIDEFLAQIKTTITENYTKKNLTEEYAEVNYNDGMEICSWSIVKVK